MIAKTIPVGVVNFSLTIQLIVDKKKGKSKKLRNIDKNVLNNKYTK